MFDEKGNSVYPVSSTKILDIDEVAKQVINGERGNGSNRKLALNNAGYDYDQVQVRVNELINGPSTQSLRSIDAIAREVINGDWGNGQDRKTRLHQAGYDYQVIQDKVNKILS